MLRIPLDSAIILSEFVCGECEGDFYVSHDPAEQLDCPRTFCEGTAHNNGSVKVYVHKNQPKDL